MEAARKEAQDWMKSEANSSDFSLEPTNDDKYLKVKIGDEYEFKINIPSVYPKAKLTVSSPNEELEDWAKQLNKQDIKTVAKFLDRARELFDSLAEEVEEGEEEEAEEQDDDEEEEIEIEGADLGDQWGEIEAPQPKKNNDEYDPEFEEYSKQFNTEGTNNAATERLMKDLKSIWRANKKNMNLGFSAQPIDNNLYHWEVRLNGFDDSDGPIAKDLKEYKKKHGIDYVKLDMKFQKDYPFSPPFIRVVKPRFQFHTGHVTIGGSICMELLTTSGWRPINDIESVLIQIRSEMIQGGARIDFANQSEYTEHEAREAFIRVARHHGWEK
eukprot:GEZU01027927.1.p1 GENE.GEZU01027927.1~~GEZU01027927.1.p1  ORF type:complete len:327 (+),score=157.29 GEZU01027927.1:179-1159(+)